MSLQFNNLPALYAALSLFGTDFAYSFCMDKNIKTLKGKNSVEKNKNNSKETAENTYMDLTLDGVFKAFLKKTVILVSPWEYHKINFKL